MGSHAEHASIVHVVAVHDHVLRIIRQGMRCIQKQCSAAALPAVEIMVEIIGVVAVNDGQTDDVRYAQPGHGIRVFHVQIRRFGQDRICNILKSGGEMEWHS